MSLLLAGLLQTGRILPVEEMAARAEIIGVARVESAVCRTDPRNNMIYTDHALRFSEVWKGEVRGGFVLMKAGGTIGTRSTAVAGEEYSLKHGEEILVFATRSSFGNHVVLGLRQGLYRKRGPGVDAPFLRESEAGRGVPKTLPELREAVYKALGKELPAEEPEASTSPEPPAPATTTSDDSRSRGTSNDVSSRRPWPELLGLAALLAAAAAVLARRTKREGT